MRISEQAISVHGNSLVEPAAKRPQKKDQAAEPRRVDQYVRATSVPADAQEKSVVARAMALPETREEKIAQVKDRVASGYYMDEAIQGEIADALLDY